MEDAPESLFIVSLLTEFSKIPLNVKNKGLDIGQQHGFVGGRREEGGGRREEAVCVLVGGGRRKSVCW